MDEAAADEFAGHLDGIADAEPVIARGGLDARDLECGSVRVQHRKQHPAHAQLVLVDILLRAGRQGEYEPDGR